MEQKREALTAWYEELAKGPDSRLPRNFVKGYRRSQAGFTDDVMDQALLDGPPEGARLTDSVSRGPAACQRLRSSA